MTIAEKLGLDGKPLFLMDGTAFIYRSFYANRHLQRSDGYPTNALVIITRLLLKILREEAPAHFLFALDGRGKNFRNEIYDLYKANREAMPEELRPQIDPIRRMVAALGLRLEVADGVEADDCIASLAARFRGEMPVVIVSGDKDLKQCLAPNVYMWDPGAKEEKLLTAAEFTAENGVEPAQWPDVQALVGDSSDNIPGVPGIGPKTARQIFAVCPTLEEIRANIGLLPPKIQAKLEAHLDSMFTWRQLTTLRLDACPRITLEDMAVKPLDEQLCAGLAAEFEMNNVAGEIAALARAKSGGLEAPATGRTGRAQAAATDLPPAVESAKRAALPDSAGKMAAIVWPEGYKRRPRVAVLEMPADNQPPALAEAEFVWTGAMADLAPWLEEAAVIVTPDFKPLPQLFPSLRGLVGKKHIDLGLASYLLNPEDGSYSWDRLKARWEEPLKCQDKGPAILALAMAFALMESLRSNDLVNLYDNLELPLTPVLADMEARGIAINPAAFQNFLKEVDSEANSLAASIFEHAGGEFNIRSPQQLGEVLFEKLGLPGAKKTKTGQYSTSQLTLEKLAGNSVVDGVLQFRRLDKMRLTYLDPLPRLMDSANRIHTTFNQEATATGRLSSSNPNLQNIPVRGPLGKRMRECFVAKPGDLLLAADYSQIELRILAHLSRDKTLLEAFHEGVDIHARTAALIFDLAEKNVSADQRRMAKTINFGLLYGMGARKLAQELKIGVSEAQKFIERYFSRLSELKNFYEKVVEGARKLGHVTTMAGRKRWLPGIFSENGQTVAQAERQAVNTVIQGSAADIIKLAMLAVARDDSLNSQNARLVLQIHDELLLEAPEAAAKSAGARVAELMENASPDGNELSVPLKVEWGVGQNWGEAH